MAHSLVKQPNGLLAVFSSIVDNFILTDATPEQIVAWCVSEAAEEERKRAEQWVKGELPGTRIRDLSDKLPLIQDVHGKAVAAKLLKEMSKPHV